MILDQNIVIFKILPTHYYVSKKHLVWSKKTVPINSERRKYYYYYSQGGVRASTLRLPTTPVAGWL